MSTTGYATRFAAVLAALLQLTCGQAILTAPAESTLIVTVNPPFIPAHDGVAIVSATLIEPAGTPVPDGTVVQFFTTLGRIEEQGKTNDGVARVKLVSDSRSGTAKITVISGPIKDESQEVTIGNANVVRILLRADPPRIPSSSNTTHVFAAVFDNFGNPIPNVPVSFTVNTPATESFDITGPVFTNNNGEAENVLRTHRQTAGAVTVTATAPNGVSSAGLSIVIQ